MPNQRRLTAIIEREDEAFVALCPELDIASEGKSIEEARANLVEASCHPLCGSHRIMQKRIGATT
jgi:hypothetical protein